MSSTPPPDSQAIAPHQAIGHAEALCTYTLAGTWLTREDAIKGSLEVGKLADLAVLDPDDFSVPEDEIEDIQVDLTIVDGKVVWQRE